MVRIKKAGPRKQELLNRFFWLRTYLLVPGRDLGIAPNVKTKLIETVWNAQTGYMQADDDDYNYNVAFEAYQMLENGLMSAGIDVETEVKAAMEKNGYSNFNQMKPLNREKVLAAIRVFDEPDQPAKDPWDL